MLISGCRQSSDTEEETAPISNPVEDNSNVEEKASAAQPEIDTSLITQKEIIGEWVYFLYPIVDMLEYYENVTALYRCREDWTELTCLSPALCDTYDVVGDSIYFASFPMSGNEHGVLHLIEPGQEPKILADEISSYQIVDGYIYYAHSYDTIGVGIEGHALHRIDLDGSNHMIAAYETNGLGIVSGHIGEIRNGYVYYENIRIKLGEPADGMEKVQVTAPLNIDYDDGWLYYATNRLIKARPDGNEQTVLDGDANTWIYIQRVDDDWIYYHQQAQEHAIPGFFKIRKDGTGKAKIDQSEYYAKEVQS